MAIEFWYGDEQRFRQRYVDLNVVGHADLALPVRAATYQLNAGPERAFYVEDVSAESVDWSFEYKPSPARLRLPNAGDFNIEIPPDAMELVPGHNELVVRILDAEGSWHDRAMSLSWSPEPVRLPLDPAHFEEAADLQEVGQVVDGRWELDAATGIVRTPDPSNPDSLLLIGPPASQQEATYQFRFLDGRRSKYVGFSDFFLGHVADDPMLPIKPLWATAGLATLRPRGEFAWEARAWISSGDAPGWRPNIPGASAKPSVARTDPPAYLPLEAGTWYRVRHRLLIHGGAHRTMFRVWLASTDEPRTWTCELSIPAGASPGAGGFGLFHHSGAPSEWREISIRAL